ncbi:MAG: hypothetical protein R3F55_24180 [Alphaproteobacteria bacterium]
MSAIACSEKAMALHRAFMDCGRILRQTFDLLESFGTRSPAPLKRSPIADLRSSFFLVVPVVSTTFASVHRMFSRLKSETLGWLLVDEAGQAVRARSRWSAHALKTDHCRR